MKLILILLGAPLGYIVSYFCQSGMVRRIASLGDYVSHCGDVLFPSEGVNRIVQSACQTAWIGTIGGLIGMIVLVAILSGRKSQS